MDYNNQLKERFLKYGLYGFDDREALELLLGLRLDRKRHRPQAESLLNRYGSLSSVIDMSLHDPGDLTDSSDGYLLGLRIPHQMPNRYLYEKVKRNRILGCSEAVVNYLNLSMRGLRTEQFKTLYLDAANKLIADEDISNGTISQAIVFPREVIRSALKHDATGLIFFHT